MKLPSFAQGFAGIGVALLLSPLAAAQAEYQVNSDAVFASIDGLEYPKGEQPIAQVRWLGEESLIELSIQVPGQTTWLLMSNELPLPRHLGATETPGGQMINLEMVGLQIIDMTGEFAFSGSVDIPVAWEQSNYVSFQLLTFTAGHPDGYVLSAPNALHYHDYHSEDFSISGISGSDMAGVSFEVLDAVTFDDVELDEFSSAEVTQPEYMGEVVAIAGNQRLVSELVLNAVTGELSRVGGGVINTLADFVPNPDQLGGEVTLEISLETAITFAVDAEVVVGGKLYFTNRACVIPVTRDGNIWRPDRTQAQSNAAVAGLNLAGPLTQTGPPTDSYNCHGFTFTCGDRWIDNKYIQKILNDNGYILKPGFAPKVPGDVVVYSDDDGNIVHTGIVVAVDFMGNPTLIESKWGAHPRFTHPPDQVPPTYKNPSYFCNGGNNKLHCGTPGGL